MSHPVRKVPAGARAFRVLLSMYPAAFRDEYGREMSLMFMDEYRDTPNRWGRARLWARALAGVVTEAPKEHMRGIRGDLRVALRRLRRGPGFALASIGTLALAIGATTATFSVLNAVVLRPLPYRSPDQLMMLWTGDPTRGARANRTGFRSIEEWRRRSQTFADVAVFDPVAITLRGVNDTEQLSGIRVSANFFGLLGVRPIEGRVFSAEEVDQRQRLVVVSSRLWRRLAFPQGIGAELELDGTSARVIGVVPEGFQFSGDTDVWEPVSMSPSWDALRQATGTGSWFAVGRLRPDATPAQAQRELSAIALQLDEGQANAASSLGVSIRPLSEYLTSPSSQLSVWMLTGAGLCVLLIAVANVASLTVARGIGRTLEMAVRTALGASRASLMRQLLIEGLALSAIASLAGVGLGLAGVRFIQAFHPGGLARLSDAGMDWRVCGWVSAISCGTGVIVGLAPASTLWRRNLQPAIKDGGRGASSGAGPRRVRRALVVAEFSLAIALLIGAGLFVRSWWAAEGVDPGFAPDRVMSLQVAVPAAWSNTERAAYYSRLVDLVRSQPDVEEAGTIGDFFVSSSTDAVVTAEVDIEHSTQTVQLRRDEVSAAFFKTVGVRLLQGRTFSTEDSANSAPVAVVNQTMAQRFWPEGTPVGKRFKLGPSASNGEWRTIVGVVRDMRRQGLESEPVAQMFEPMAQNPSRLSTLLVRTSRTHPLGFANTIRAAARQIDTRVTLYGASSLDARLGSYLAERRFQTLLLLGFSVVAILLAATGVYGLIQYSVAARTREIGIRVAIGAQARDIFGMILREGLMLSGIGIGLGLAMGGFLGRASSRLLFGVSGTDPLTFFAVAATLGLVALAACAIPAYRATWISPTVAIRPES